MVQDPGLSCPTALGATLATLAWERKPSVQESHSRSNG